MAYLLKVTLIWTVFLLLFEAFYKNSGRFTANRCYLIITMLLGLLLPLVHMPEAYTAGQAVARSLNTMLPATATAVAAPVADNTPPQLSRAFILQCLYAAGAVVLLVISLREIVIILRHAIYSHYRDVDGHKVFAARRELAPYSFMGWIFISAHTSYSPRELTYVLEHEAAHNSRRHWLDLLLMQLLCILCWFHPLAWRYRYLLRLQHEYEADFMAGGEDAYHYGHFLLQQVLLKGTPFVAHSFHFSPIKNRINMLTKTTGNRFGFWKYAMVVPAVLACTLLMAKANEKGRLKAGNKTSFNGNDVYWKNRPADTIMIADPVTGKWRNTVQSNDPVITQLNNEPVAENNKVSLPAQFRNDGKNFDEYLKARLDGMGVKVPDSIGQIQVNKLVINREGRIVYYELLYLNANPDLKSFPPPSTHPTLDPVLNQILEDSPNWLPASDKGKPIAVYLERGGTMALKTISFQGKFKLDGKIINHPGALQMSPAK